MTTRYNILPRAVEYHTKSVTVCTAMCVSRPPSHQHHCSVQARLSFIFVVQITTIYDTADNKHQTMSTHSRVSTFRNLALCDQPVYCQHSNLSLLVPVNWDEAMWMVSLLCQLSDYTAAHCQLRQALPFIK